MFATRLLLFGLSMMLAQGAAVADDGSAPKHSEPRQAIRSQIDAGHFEEAEKEGRSHLAEMERLHGPDAVEVASTLDLLVECLWRSGRGDAPEAMALARRALAIKEARLGDRHVEVAVSLRNLGRVLELSGQPDETIAVYHRAVDILETSPDAEPAQLVRTLIFLGNLHLGAASYDRALDVFERALSESQSIADGPRLDAFILHNIGIVHFETGRYPESRAAFERALALKAPGSLDEAWTLNGLAVLFQEMGRYEEAGALYERVLKTREEELGSSHVQTIDSRNNLANLLGEMGDLTRARGLHTQNRALVEASLGKNSLEIARTLNGLAMLDEAIGDYGAATALQEDALRIRRAREEIVQAATTLTQLGFLDLKQGRPDSAARRFEEARGIYVERLGASHPDVAYCLGGLADARAAAGDLKEARTLHTRELEILTKAFGPVHHQVARCRNTLGRIALDTGDTTAARGFLEEALAVRQATLGNSHPLVGETLVSLGRALASVGDHAAALDDALRAEGIGRDHLRAAVATLPERQALLYAGVRSSGLDLAASLAADRRDAPSILRIWDAVIRSRALVLDEMAGRWRAAVGGDDPALGRLTRELSAAVSRLAMLVQRGPGDHLPQLYAGLVNAAATEKERLEVEIAGASLPLRRALAARSVGIERVRESLQRDAALVAFLLYDRLAPAAPPGSAQSARGATAPVPSYMAFVLNGATGEASATVIGSREAIDGLVRAWADEAARPGGSEKEYRAVGDRLRVAIWDPLVSRLSGARLVLVVPDGAVNHVNFQALPEGESRYLIETGPTIHLLSAEREIVRGDGKTGSRLLVVANPDYDDSSSLSELAGGGRPAEPTAPSPRAGCARFRDVRFAPLPATQVEAEEILSLWREARGPAAGSGAGATADAIRLSEAAATEGAFKRQAAGADVIHLATHGFFLEGSCRASDDALRGIGGSSPSAEAARPGGASLELADGNPMLLSGLVLAGANHRLQVGEGEEDGILSAQEIAALDLSEAGMVVLSACDTGRGAILSGEGIFGLRRAFELAGARALVLSLWAVEDRAAREWMRDFYRKRLVEGLGVAFAVREAGLAALSKRKAEGRSTHPFWWGAWVGTGAWD